MRKGKFITIFSIIVFSVNFLTFLNLNVTKSTQLQSAGYLISLICLFLFLAGLILVIKESVKKKMTGIRIAKPKATANLSSGFPHKRIIGFFVLIWFLIGYPLVLLILLSQSSTSGISKENIGEIIGGLAVIYLAVLPGQYLLPPFCLINISAMILGVYFIFSRKWRGWIDIFLILLLAVFISIVPILNGILSIW